MTAPLATAARAGREVHGTLRMPLDEVVPRVPETPMGTSLQRRRPGAGR